MSMVNSWLGIIFCLTQSGRLSGLKDADVSFPAAADAFTGAIGFQTLEDKTPYFYQLMRRTLADTSLSPTPQQTTTNAEVQAMATP